MAAAVPRCCPRWSLALALAPERLLRRAALIGTLLASIVVVAGLVQLWSERYPGAVGLHDILWTGKGVATGWAGLSWDKAWMMLSGVGNYFLIVGGWVDPLSAKRTAAPLIALGGDPGRDPDRRRRRAVAAPRRAAPARDRHRLPRHAGRGAGAQPLRAAAGPADAAQRHAVARGGVGAAAGRVAAALARGRHRAGASASLLPFVWNVGQLARFRGGDEAALKAVAALEQRFPPASTVFVYWGFEPITMWQYALWSRTWDWDGKPSDAKFKWIAIDAGAIRHPDWTAAHNAEVLKRDIDHALDRGYRVVVSDVWTWNEAELTGQLGALSAAERAPAIYRMLHDNYRARPVFD